MTLALLLAATRLVSTTPSRSVAATWQTTIGRELHGRVLGIVGYGSIGALVGGYGRALGMHVLAWGREGSLERARSDGHEPEPDLEALFAHAPTSSASI